MPISFEPSWLPPIVLVVDPNPDTREMYETALGLAGVWMGHAQESDDALQYAFELRPDTVVIDLGLPGPAQGLALARKLREDPRTAGTPIVAVTVAERSGAAAQSGVFQEIFAKPVQLDCFVRHMRWLAAQAAVLRERNARTRARAPEIVAESARLLSRSADVNRRISTVPLETRPCPDCRKPLRFVERRALDGVLFDYYTSCPSGCGLYCYDHSRRSFVLILK